ncbi:uncharacterized protein LOC120319783 isoform X2 [Crotalus tigris]|uniref:uncharacterized protein LOC120319783 isoform X2 n=1 Tax=Crotalus tigris TaxID=88082 RepID=UPI00192FA0A2|nr:uncharacterized protein LOC120319783 isoform X2 [Crotalus tigris]
MRCRQYTEPRPLRSTEKTLSTESVPGDQKVGNLWYRKAIQDPAEGGYYGPSGQAEDTGQVFMNQMSREATREACKSDGGGQLSWHPGPPLLTTSFGERKSKMELTQNPRPSSAPRSSLWTFSGWSLLPSPGWASLSKASQSCCGAHGRAGPREPPHSYGCRLNSEGARRGPGFRQPEERREKRSSNAGTQLAAAMPIKQGFCCPRNASFPPSGNPGLHAAAVLLPDGNPTKCSLLGTWKNDLNSTMEIPSVSNTGVFSGLYKTEVSSSGKPVPSSPLQGIQHLGSQPTFGFTVSWKVTESITVFVGQCLMDENGKEQLKTTWLLRAKCLLRGRPTVCLSGGCFRSQG